MSSTDLFEIAAVFVLLVIAGVLAAAEVGITRMTRIRALTLDEEGRRGSVSLVRIAENPARYLIVVLLIIMVCHVTATPITTALSIRRGASAGEVIATDALTVVIFVFAEVSPKTFAAQHTDRVSLRLAPLVH